MKSRTVVQGWYSDEEGARLVELANSTPGLVVELGTAWGKSIAYVLDSTDKNVVCVDTWDGTGDVDYGGAYEYFTTLLKEEGWEHRVEMIRSSTQKAAQTWDRPIGLLHIDASHEYEDVLSDFLLWSPFIVRGGAIALHDQHYDGPKRVVEEQLLRDNRWVDRREIFVQWSARLSEEPTIS